MMDALKSTVVELLDSKKAAYSFVATLLAICLIQFLHWPVETAMLVVAPLGVATLAQAHVDAKANTPPIAAPVQVTTVEGSKP